MPAGGAGGDGAVVVGPAASVPVSEETSGPGEIVVTAVPCANACELPSGGLIGALDEGCKDKLGDLEGDVVVPKPAGVVPEPVFPKPGVVPEPGGVVPEPGGIIPELGNVVPEPEGVVTNEVGVGTKEVGVPVIGGGEPGVVFWPSRPRLPSGLYGIELAKSLNAKSATTITKNAGYLILNNIENGHTSSPGYRYCCCAVGKRS